MPRKKGFTLVELLVVVAIIALLIAILVPALKKSQKQARAVVCQSNLKQWATITHMYTLDHDSRFWHHVGMLGGWMEKLEPYYGKTDDFRTCPEATEDCVNIDPPGTANREFRGSVDTMWGIRGIQHEFGGREEGYWGSYGLNAWVTTPMPGAVDTLWDSARWKTTAVKGAAKTLSMTLRLLDVAREHQIPCFCADSAAIPILVDWNKNLAARLAPFPGLSMGLLESNGQQNYARWDELVSYHPCAGATWTMPANGVFHLDADFYARSGGIFLPSDHYTALFQT